MIATGKINPFTGDEIMKVEVSDISWNKSWQQLSLPEKADVCALIGAPYITAKIEKQYNRNRKKFM